MIKSKTFGGVILSGDDARKFANQARFGRASQAAVDSLRHGDNLLQSFRLRTSETKDKEGDDSAKRKPAV